MSNDVTLRPSDSRPVLKGAIIPHLKLGKSISASGPSTHSVFHFQQSCQTETKEFCSVECQTDDIESSSENIPQYHSVECQTDPIDDGISFGTKRKAPDSSLSSLASSSSISFNSSSRSVYEPTLSDIEEAEDDQEEDDEEIVDEFDDTEDVQCNFGPALSSYEKIKLCEWNMRLMEKSLLHYTGIPYQSAYVIDLITRKCSVNKRNLFLILRKIRHNESLEILGDVFGISRQQAGYIFRTEIEKVATCLQPFIYWPDPTYIQRNLPLQFKHKYKRVQVIIDCFESAIAKPRKPLDQALSYSTYKHANTVKYLIGCTPDGKIIFISKGFLGRISDNEIVRRSGFLNFIKQGTVVMADRGFKDLESEIASKGGILIKPPSITSGIIYTKEEAQQCKSIAAVRIHVERVIGKLRIFNFLKPRSHSLLSSKRAYLLEYSIIIASAICNMQGLLTKI